MRTIIEISKKNPLTNILYPSTESVGLMMEIYLKSIRSLTKKQLERVKAFSCFIFAEFIIYCPFPEANFILFSSMKGP